MYLLGKHPINAEGLTEIYPHHADFFIYHLSGNGNPDPEIAIPGATARTTLSVNVN